MWEKFVINSFLSILNGVVKNPAKAAALKEALLNVRDTINVLYSGN